MLVYKACEIFVKTYKLGLIIFLLMGFLRKHWKKPVKVAALGIALVSGLVYSMHRSPVNYTRSDKGSYIGSNFRVMTANAARGEGDILYVQDLIFPNNKGTKGISALENMIKEQAIDVACFQEIEAAYTHRENQPKEIADNTPLRNYVFGQNFSFQLPFMPDSWFADGNAIHSKASLYDVEKVLFYKGNPSALVRWVKPIAGLKGVLHAKIDYERNDGRLFPVNILCTHLSAVQLDSYEREFEMGVLFEHAARNTPAIVLGDLNTVPIGARYALYPGGTDYSHEVSWYIAKDIAKVYGVDVISDPRLHLFEEDAFPEFPATFPGKVSKDKLGLPGKPDWSVSQKVIDYILIVSHPDDSIKLRFKDMHVDYSRRCSDHAPVIADIEVVE